MGSTQSKKQQQSQPPRPRPRAKGKQWKDFEADGRPTQVFSDAYMNGKTIKKGLDKILGENSYAIRLQLNHYEIKAWRTLSQAEIETLKQHYKDHIEAHEDESKLS